MMLSRYKLYTESNEQVARKRYLGESKKQSKTDLTCIIETVFSARHYFELSGIQIYAHMIADKTFATFLLHFTILHLPR
jgi:hypothetical protein